MAMYRAGIFLPGRLNHGMLSFASHCRMKCNNFNDLFSSPRYSLNLLTAVIYSKR